MNKLFITLALSLIIFIPCVVLFVSCDPPVKPEEDSLIEHAAELKLSELIDEDVEIIIIENCEYIVYKHHEGRNLGFGFMAHKGNCKNPIHCYNVVPLSADSISN